VNTRRVALNTAVVFGVLLLVYLAWVFRQALIIFFFSLAVAAAVRPLADRLSKRGLAQGLALLLVYLVSFIVLAVIIMLVGNSLLRELQLAADSLAQSYERIWQEWPQGTEFQQLIVGRLPAPADLYESFSIDQPNSALQPIMGFTLSWFNFLSQVSIIIILSIYWSLDRVHFERLWLSLLPVGARARYRDMWRDIERDFGAYMRSELFQSLLAGILLGLGYWVIGLPFPTLLALFGALAWLMPWLGGVLAILPAVLAGLSIHLGLGSAAALYAIAVLFFLEFVIEPRFIRRRQYSSLLSILMILALVQPFGLLGLVVAPPLAAALELAFRYNLQNRPKPLPDESVQRIAELQDRLDIVRQMIAGQEEEPEPQTINLLNRLENLVEKANELLEDNPPKPVHDQGPSRPDQVKASQP
jgi:predicted PurR-regulated permease PerM